MAGYRYNRDMMFSRLFPLTCLLLVAATARADIYSYTDANGTVHFSNVPDNKRYVMVLRTPREKSAPLGVGQSQNSAENRQRFAPLVADAASRYQLDAALLHAVIATESAYNPRALSRKGAGGLMQLMPDTARRYGVSDMFDPAQNVQGGARYLSDLMQMFNQDLNLALAAYNAGENAVLRHGNRIPPYAETQAYVPKVMGYYQQYRLARN
jgi:soluble lytic murein transglycosylase-like protein